MLRCDAVGQRKLDTVQRPASSLSAIIPLERLPERNGTGWGEGGGVRRGEGALERYRYALLNLRRRRFHYVWREKVQSAVNILLAVLVEHSPGAALWHSFHGREVIEIRD